MTQVDVLRTPRRVHVASPNALRLAGVIYVGPGTAWDNPFKVGEQAPHRHPAGAHPNDMYTDYHAPVTQSQCVGLYRRLITEPDQHQYVGWFPPTLEAIRSELAGRDLACTCEADEPCHVDVLLDLANTPA